MSSAQTPRENSCQSSRPALISNLKGPGPRPPTLLNRYKSALTLPRPLLASFLERIVMREPHFPALVVSPGTTSLSVHTSGLFLVTCTILTFKPWITCVVTVSEQSGTFSHKFNFKLHKSVGTARSEVCCQGSQTWQMLMPLQKKQEPCGYSYFAVATITTLKPSLQAESSAPLLPTKKT